MVRSTRLLLVLPLLGFFLLSLPVSAQCAEPAEAATAQAAATRPGRAALMARTFIDEELIYKIGFWFLDDVATGRVTLKNGEGDGEFVATLSAKTTGFLGWLLSHRKDTYVERLRLAEGGTRFVTESFDKTIDMGGKVRHGITVVDYEKKRVSWKSWGGGKDDRSGVSEIPAGVRVDGPLTAFYNFRSGVYGPVEEGREYRITTFPKSDRVPEIYMRVATDAERKKRIPAEKAYADYVADVKIDKDLFGQKEGDVEIIFNSDIVPVEAVAKDLIYFGDIRGRLTQMGVEMDLKKNFDNSSGAVPAE